MFNFFKVIPLTKTLKIKKKIISYCNNTTYKVFCNIDDEVQIFWNDWECITLQVQNLKFCCIPEDTENLLLLCQHPNSRKIVLKVYIISIELGRKIVTLISNACIESNSKVTALSASNFSDSQLCIAIGLDNGNIIFYKNYLQKEISLNAFKCLNVTTKQIKGVKFTTNRDNLSMFVCSDVGIYCYTISNNIILGETKLTLDDMDSTIHCITMKPAFNLTGDQYLVVARDDGLYCYTADGRGPCYAISGLKQIVECFGKQMVIVLKSEECLYLNRCTSNLLIYDMDNKITVLNKEFGEVLCLLPTLDQSSCLILQNNGDIFTLKEQEMRYKLSKLLKKNLYDIALKILEESRNNSIVSHILVKYGDYLLQRGDPLGAVHAYSKTIGTAPPFLIINKLRDFRYNEYLIQYLFELVQKENVPEHLDLLNNCYRRVDLPTTTHRVFKSDECNHTKLYVDRAAVNSNLNFLVTINSYQKNQDILLNYFFELPKSEAENFLLDYGYSLINKYPEVSTKIIKYVLSDDILRNNIFYKILLPLSLMNKLNTMNFFDKLSYNCEFNSIFIILTELILQMWLSGDIDTMLVIMFFESNQTKMSSDNIFVICRNYKFWPGIKIMFDKCGMYMHSIYCLLKCIEPFPEYINIYTEENGWKKLNEMWIHILKMENLARNLTLHYVTDIVTNILNSNPYYILEVVNSFVNCDNFLLSHLDELLLQEFFFSNSKCDELYRMVSFFEDRVIHKVDILNNYLKRPIEFRSRSCDICSQMIKQPMVIFLCQHSYHRECITQYNETLVCIVCTDIQKYTQNIKKAELYRYIDSEKDNKNFVVGIFKQIGQLNFQCDDIIRKTNTAGNDNKIEIYENSKPYAIQHEKNCKSITFNCYDANLNPLTNDKYNQ